MPSLRPLLLLLAIGCSAPDAADPSLDGVAARRVGHAFGHSQGRGHDWKGDGPCADGSWGDIDGRRAVHVRENGDDATADGSRSKPFRSLDAALHSDYRHGAGHGGDNGTWTIALGPGEYDGNLAISSDRGWLRVQGCGPLETTLVSDAASPGARIDGKVELEGLTLQGGKHGLDVQPDAHLKTRDVSARDAHEVGVLLRPGAQADLRRTRVFDVSPVDHMGWGIAAIDATLEMQGGGVYGATEIGVFAEGGDLDLDDIEVFDTHPSGRWEKMGRGVHVQNGTNLTLTGSLLRNNADTGVFVLKGGAILVDGLVIDITSAGIVIDLPSTGATGDGIVVKDSYDVSILDSLVLDSFRAGMLFDDSAVELSGNEVDGSGLVIGDTSQFSQRSSQVAGDDADQVLELSRTLILQGDEIPTSRFAD